MTLFLHRGYSMKTLDVFNVVRGMMHVNLNNRVEETVLLAGFPRGGTTWVSEIINHRNEYRYLFEPFYPRYVPSLKNLRPKDYWRPGGNPRGVDSMAIERIIKGRIRNPWVDRFNRKVMYNKILIKDIRIHLILGWLKRRFPYLKIVLLLRHPLGVAVSLQKIGWLPGVKKYCENNELVEDYLRPFVEPMLEGQTQLERYVFSWCVEHYVPLQQLARVSDVYVCFYEWFCVNVVEETEKLFVWLGKDGRDLVESRLRKPSKMSKQHSAVNTGEDMVRRWTKSLSQEEIQRSVEILRLFRLDRIYDESPFPYVQTPISPTDLAAI